MCIRDRAAVVQIAVGYVEETVACLAAGISLYDPQRAEVAIVGSTPNYLPSGSRLPITQPDALAAIAKGHVYTFADITPLAASSPGMRRLAEMGGRSLLSVPLRAGEALPGLLWIPPARRHKVVSKSYEARGPLEYSDELATRAPGFTLRVQRERRESRCDAKTAWDRSLWLHQGGWYSA